MKPKGASFDRYEFLDTKEDTKESLRTADLLVLGMRFWVKIPSSLLKIF